MPSSYSASCRFELQFTGENVNVWGIKLNATISRVDFSIAGRAIVGLTGAPYALTSSNQSDDESRASTLEFVGTGSTVTIPSVPKKYTVQNSCVSGQVIITTGSGLTVAIDPTDIVDIVCDGTNVEALGFNGLSLKNYIAAQALSAVAGQPSVVGNDGKYQKTDGVSAFWDFVNTVDIPDYASDQATKTAAATGRAIAFSIAL